MHLHLQVATVHYASNCIAVVDFVNVLVGI